MIRTTKPWAFAQDGSKIQPPSACILLLTWPTLFRLRQGSQALQRRGQVVRFAPPPRQAWLGRQPALDEGAARSPLGRRDNRPPWVSPDASIIGPLQPFPPKLGLNQRVYVIVVPRFGRSPAFLGRIWANVGWFKSPPRRDFCEMEEATRRAPAFADFAVCFAVRMQRLRSGFADMMQRYNSPPLAA